MALLDEFLGPVIGGFMGTSGVTDDLEFDDTLDVWGNTSSFPIGPEVALGEREGAIDKVTIGLGGQPRFKKPLGETVDGDEIADKRAKERGLDVTDPVATGNWVDMAKSQLGTPYVWAGASTSGFDCSGFTSWLVKRATGRTLPHNSAAQQAALKPVSREDLQPGDLLFFHYSDRNGAGAASHVEVYLGGGKMIGTANTTEDLDIDDVDWENFIGGGATGIMRGGASKKAAAPELTQPVKKKVTKKPAERVQEQAVLGIADGPPTMSNVLWSMLAPDVEKRVEYAQGEPIPTEDAPQFSGAQADIKRQLYQGFMDAGRADLARMVGTKEFATWIGQESGWRPDAVSPAFNQGQRNDGLFQIWRGHSYNNRGQVSQMSPYEQAQIVVRYFDLTPGDIRRYAEQIRSGTYPGWG